MSFQAVKNGWHKRVDSQLMQILENLQGILSSCNVKR